MNDTVKTWVVPEVKEKTRRYIKALAAAKGVKIGEALDLLVEAAEKKKS